MTPQEVAQLLTIDATFTGRPIDPAIVQSWHALLEDLDGKDCLDALRTYYRESTDGRWIMPGHIVQRVRTIMFRRREELQVAEHLAIMAQPANPEKTRLAIEGAKTALKEPKAPPRGDRANECPWCKAKPGRPCTTPVTGKLISGVHPSRLEAAA
jgi:hypothetical protein